MQALNTVAALNPRAVVAGHKNEEFPTRIPKIIDETRNYLLDAQRLLSGNPSPEEFFAHMMRLPDTWSIGSCGCAVALLS